jgi:ATP-dependent DNA helicase DinG
VIVKCSYPVLLSGKSLLEEALEGLAQGVVLEEIPEVPRHSIVVYLGEAQARRLSAIGTRTKLSLGKVVEQMAYGLHQARLRSRGEKKEGDLSEVERQRARLVSETIAGLDGGQIVLAEASTGLGKSRALAHAARHLLKADARVWVAAPYLSVLAHLLAEFSQVEGIPRPAVLLGRQQFVSVARLRHFMGELSPGRDDDVLQFRETIEQWLAGGGLPTTPETKTLAGFAADTGEGLSYLMEDLRLLAPLIPAASVCLLDKQDADTEPGERAVLRMNEAVEQARLVFCTHTMLMLRTRLARPESVPFTHLLIDEVHLLEEAAARLESSELSLHSLRSWFRRNGGTRAREMIANLSILMQEMADRYGSRTSRHADAGALELLREALKPVEQALRKMHVRKLGSVEAAERTEFLDAMGRFFDSDNRLVIMSFSPLRRYPSITVGPYSVRWLMEKLWENTVAVAGMSATLYTPSAGGGISNGYLMSKLAVPPGRLCSVGPVTLAWNTSTPTLCHPDHQAAERLCFPGAYEEEGGQPPPMEYQNWMESVVQALRQATSTAAGGTLVLCPAFQDIHEIASRLASDLGARLLFQSKGVSIQAQRAQYEALYRQGIKPVWLAAGGGAWQGLDLRDATAENPALDFLLTDLVILRPAFRQRSSTDWYRQQRRGFKVVLMEAALYLRQGAGRLIRREGLLQRRLWMLDGRLFTARQPRYQVLASVFRGYTKREAFALSPG